MSMPALEDLRGRAEALNAELDRAVARIRELPGYRHFLAPVTAADIAQAAWLVGNVGVSGDDAGRRTGVDCQRNTRRSRGRG